MLILSLFSFSTDGDDFNFFSGIWNYIGWPFIGIFCGLTYCCVRYRMQQRRQRQQGNCGQRACFTTSNGQGVVIPPPTGTSHPPPPPGTYPTQTQGNYQHPQPAADVPPQYDAVVTAKDGAPQMPPYPTQISVAPYPQGGGALYPPQGSGAPYPPQNAQAYYNPAFPPADYTPTTDNTNTICAATIIWKLRYSLHSEWWCWCW